MRLGVISDTHDNVYAILTAMRLFRREGVDRIVHCGDVISPGTIAYFKGIPTDFVRGNCDSQLDRMHEAAKAVGGLFAGEFHEIVADGRAIAALHGDDTKRLDEATGRYDIVLTGHTHKSRIERVGKALVVNPGSHYYGGEGKVALVDTAQGTATLCSFEEEP